MSRKEAVIATILLVIFGTGMHFVHHFPWFNHFWGYIFPVTESVMAHMKMNFYPMLLFAIYLVITRRDIKEFGAPILAGLAVMPVVVLVFYSYWIFVRHEILPLDFLGPALAQKRDRAQAVAALDCRGRPDHHPDRGHDLPLSGLADFPG